MQTPSEQNGNGSTDASGRIPQDRHVWTGIVRRATEGDLPEIARLVADGWRRAYREIVPPTLLEAHCDLGRRTAELQAAWDRGDLILTAVSEEGELLGTVGDYHPSRLRGFDAEIDRLYVHPDTHGSGIGRALVTALVNEFFQSGCQSMAVHTFQANRPGRGFYEKLGGYLHSADRWERFPCVWYTWDAPAMARLVLKP